MKSIQTNGKKTQLLSSMSFVSDTLKKKSSNKLCLYQHWQFLFKWIIPRSSCYLFIYKCFSTDQKFVVRKAISKPRSYPRHQVDLHIFFLQDSHKHFVLWNQWHSYDNSQWHVESVRASLTKAIAFSSFVSASLLSELAIQH